jgi:hypothetical protein
MAVDPFIGDLRLTMAAASSNSATRLGVVNVGLTALSSKEFDAPVFHCETGKERQEVEIAPELTGHGLPLIKCEAYNRVYDQLYGSN